MHILPPVRPEHSIERLTAVLEPIAEKVKLAPRKRITRKHKGRQQMYLFRKESFLCCGHLTGCC